jgi:hypothetical protein
MESRCKMICDTINEWDPIDLFPYAPSDEYEEEIELLEDFLQRHTNASVDVLAEEIYKIFVQRFGNDVFNKNMAECRLIATKILKNLTS